MKIVLALLLGTLATLSACKNPSDSSAAMSVRCACGTPEADFEGCAHPQCVRGERNPENPACVCGPMKMGGKQ